MRPDSEGPAPDRSPDDSTSLFRALRERPTPELDSTAAWRRLRAALPERERAPIWAGFGWRRALAGAVVVALVLVLGVQWTGILTPAGPVLESPSGSTGIGPFATAPEGAPVEAASDPSATVSRPAEATGATAEAIPVPPGESPVPPGESPAPTGETPRYVIEIRLLQALDDAETPPLAAGGADPLGDLRASLATLMPDRDFTVTGSWTETLAAGPMEGRLNDLRAISFEVDPDDPTRLVTVRLTGDDVELVADQIDLRTGEPYVFGIREASGETGEMLLAIRLRPIERNP